MKRITADNASQPSSEDAGAQSKTVSLSTSSGTPQSPGEQRQRNVLPPEIMEILVPSTQIGAITGSIGLFAGAVGGIVRSPNPILFATASGIQWFALGSSYYASRAVIEKAWGGHDRLTTTDRIQASAMAGGFSGMIGGLIRGPKNIAPGILAFSLLGAGGQVVANTFTGYSWKDTKSSILSSKWSPVKPLSDQEYEKYLQEKLLRVEAELALLDDNVKALRETEQKAKQQPQEALNSVAGRQA